MQDAPVPAPSASLFGHLRQALQRHPPFSQMEAQDIDAFLAQAQERYFAPDEVVIEPASGPVRELFFVRQGAVSGVRGLAELSGGAFQYEAGDLFPVSAATAGRPVTASYRATTDTFLLALPVDAMRALAQRSAVFGDFLNRRILQFLELSRRALQVAYSSQALAEQSLETPLGELATRVPVTCAADAPLREALTLMHERRIGSVLVTDDHGRPAGILTRYDVLGRVALPGVPLHTPMREVMVAPVKALTVRDTAQDAALLMSREGIRHVPVTRDGVLVGVVSERDLFALQRLSLQQVSTAIRSAADEATLKLVAQDIRRLARNLLSQGVQARQLTTLVSHLNDVLAERLIQLKGVEHGIDMARLCWVALGSEGRGEQTVATDQDNALILHDGATEADRQRVLAFARAVNRALDACGYPLCTGGIMAGEPACCLTLREWRERFAGWIEHGAPHDLLQASIFFDLRPLAGDAAMADTLMQEVLQAARRNPRFLKQLALNALQRSVPLNWHGGIDTADDGTVDLKLQGTAIFVDAARLYALAQGLAVTGTRDRLHAAGQRLGVPVPEYEGWIGGFEFLQMLRLRVQLEGGAGGKDANRVAPVALHEIDRRILRESFRVARLLQQRMQLDYER